MKYAQMEFPKPYLAGKEKSEKKKFWGGERVKFLKETPGRKRKKKGKDR